LGEPLSGDEPQGAGRGVDLKDSLTLKAGVKPPGKCVVVPLPPPGAFEEEDTGGPLRDTDVLPAMEKGHLSGAEGQSLRGEFEPTDPSPPQAAKGEGIENTVPPGPVNDNGLFSEGKVYGSWIDVSVNCTIPVLNDHF